MSSALDRVAARLGWRIALQQASWLLLAAVGVAELALLPGPWRWLGLSGAGLLAAAALAALARARSFSRPLAGAVLDALLGGAALSSAAEALERDDGWRRRVLEEGAQRLEQEPAVWRRIAVRPPTGAVLGLGALLGLPLVLGGGPDRAAAGQRASSRSLLALELAPAGGGGAGDPQAEGGQPAARDPEEPSGWALTAASGEEGPPDVAVELPPELLELVRQQLGEGLAEPAAPSSAEAGEGAGDRGDPSSQAALDDLERALAAGDADAALAAVETLKQSLADSAQGRPAAQRLLERLAGKPGQAPGGGGTGSGVGPGGGARSPGSDPSSADVAASPRRSLPAPLRATLSRYFAPPRGS